MDRLYNPNEIEPRWQRIWEERNIFKVTEDRSKKKYYCLEMFPYPSGRIHMGHVRNYSIGDVIARYKKMRGYNVLHPIGWDAFGMPAENAAIANKTHPHAWTAENIRAMKSQIQRMGFSYDWDREVTTCLPEYYRWEQRLFLQMFKKGLAYKKRSTVNWCDHCRTVLANEQVEGGACWRCDQPVRMKPLDQWFFKITGYAKELLDGTRNLKGWPERVLTMQREWIGQSEGVTIRFDLESGGVDATFMSERRIHSARANTGGGSGGEVGVAAPRYIDVFTTRPDTLFGATFMSLAAEHPLVLELSKGKPQETEVRRFVERVSKIEREKRLAGDYEKEGVFTGAYCLNPVNGRRLPVYAANFVFMEYGTGAVMAVPAHDQRDFEFARKYNLPVVVVIQPSPKEPLDPLTMKGATCEPGVMVNSGRLDGIPSERAKEEMINLLGPAGRKTTMVKLRDWGISRQRYWGAPIPILYCPNCGMVPVPEKDLPVVLPTDVPLTGEGGSPLSKVKAFVETRCPQCPATARRETDTMDTFVESSWYFLRYCSPRDGAQMFDSKAASYWMPVDQYIGGIEHAVLHLLYARFFTKVLRDLGYFSNSLKEPFENLLTQGMVIKDGAKMSKSRGNVVDPDRLIEKYGADTVRLFCLFAAPPEKDLDWSDAGVEGGYRFLRRVWTLIYESLQKASLPEKGDLEEQKRLHRTIRKVTGDLDKFHFNTAIAALMELYNFLSEAGRTPSRNSLAVLVQLVSPFAPHMAEELWQALGSRELVSQTSWPVYEESLVQAERVTLIVQVNGVLRGRLQVSPGISGEEAKRLALSESTIQKFAANKKIVKTIYVKDRLVNLVIR